MPHCDHRHPIHPSNLGRVNLGFTNNHTLQVWNTICMAEWLWRPRTHLISALTRSQSLPQRPERTRYGLTDGNRPLQVKWISKTDQCRWIWDIVRDGLGGLVCWTNIIHTIMYLTCYLLNLRLGEPYIMLPLCYSQAMKNAIKMPTMNMILEIICSTNSKI